MRYSWLLVLLAPLFAAASDDEVRANYLLACRGCHLADGSGVPPEIPTLRNTLGVPAVLQSRLSDEKLTEVLNWVLTEFNADTLPKNFQPLTTREVTAARKQILADPIGYRRARLSGKTSLE
jgi:CxxC motif-containing protein (DUF1111 family)